MLNKMINSDLEFKMAEFVERRNIERRSLGLSPNYSYFFAEKTNTAYIRIVDTMVSAFDFSYILQNVDGDFVVFSELKNGVTSFLFQFT